LGKHSKESAPRAAGWPGKYVAVWQKQSDGSYKIIRYIGATDLP
jgi:hypothetical protein